MEMSLFTRKLRRERGFTLIETMVAIVILSIGLMGVAALMSQTVNTSAHSRYMSTAAMMASEKLEDLNRFPSNDVNVAAGGSLVANTPGYFDTVQISTGNGSITESINGTTVTHLPDGTVTAVAGGAPAPTPDTMTFNRRWIVEANAPVAGVRRVTVLITLQNTSLKPAVTFQSSLVRP